MQITQVARHEILNVPLRSIHKMNTGVPVQHQQFWKGFSINLLFRMYKAMIVTPSKVIGIIEEPSDMNAAEQRVFGFLTSFVGNLSAKTELPNFLRFVTGSSVPIGKPIVVEFNNMTGLSRRPIAHTCGCVLKLSVAYSTSLEFTHEFQQVLSSELAWIMDAV